MSKLTLSILTDVVVDSDLDRSMLVEGSRSVVDMVGGIAGDRKVKDRKVNNYNSKERRQAVDKYGATRPQLMRAVLYSGLGDRMVWRLATTVVMIKDVDKRQNAKRREVGEVVD